MWRLASRSRSSRKRLSQSRAPAARKAALASYKPQFELLEDRTVPATLTPTTFSDGTGPGTLRYAIAQANSNNQDNTIALASGTYVLAPAYGGELALRNVGHTLTIQGTGQTIIHAGGGSRDFEVIGNATVVLSHLTLAGGLATDSGSIGGSEARGGAMLINGGNVTLNAVSVLGNVAQGATGVRAYGGGIYANVATLTIVNSTISGNRAQGGFGAAGPAGANAQDGQPGQAAGGAHGGGLYVIGGSLSITGSTISANAAIGGDGGAGGRGGDNNTPVPSGVRRNPNVVNNNRFFGAGLGFFPYGFGFGPYYGYGFGPYGYGYGLGSGFYGSTTGFTTGPGGTFGPGFTSGPGTLGPGGTTGGGFTGGTGGFSGGGFSGGGSGGGSGSQRAAATAYRGGDGGVGGRGGNAQGGGLYVAGGNVVLTRVTISDNSTRGGVGGRGGDPGNGTPPGSGGDGGAGGLSQGGGIYIGDGSVTLTNDIFGGNQTYDGIGGAPGTPGSGRPGNGYPEVGQGERVYRAGGTLNAPATVSALDSVGAFDPGTAMWYLRSQYGPGAPTVAPFAYGGRGWTPVVGDWNGDGITTIGVVDPNGVWYLRNENSPGTPDIKPFAYGAPGWIPVVGDWNNTGHDGIGMFDPSTGTWYLRNEDSPGPPDAGVFAYGAPGTVPVTGDWRGTGMTGIGVVDPKTMTWYLRDTAGAGAPTLPPFLYGSPGQRPVTGDWADHGAFGIGVVDPSTGTWQLRNEPNPGDASGGMFRYGAPQWDYVAGHWAGPLGVASHPLAEHAAGGAIISNPAPTSLTNQQLQTIVSAALVRLKNAGVDQTELTRLRSATYEVGPLSGSLVGYTYARDNTVVISPRAAGYGWFIDPTPLSDQEFTRNRNGTLTAFPGSPAYHHMDLLTVVLHEMGHLAGWRDVSGGGNADNLMDTTLAPGQRRIDALDAVFSGMK